MKDVANPYFLAEAGEYLEAAGYIRHNATLTANTIYFLKGHQAVEVTENSISFLMQQASQGAYKEFTCYQSFAGIADLDIFRWMLLFHIGDIVPLQQLIREVRSEEQPVQQAEGFNAEKAFDMVDFANNFFHQLS